MEGGAGAASPPGPRPGAGVRVRGRRGHRMSLPGGPPALALPARAPARAAPDRRRELLPTVRAGRRAASLRRDLTPRSSGLARRGHGRVQRHAGPGLHADGDQSATLGLAAALDRRGRGFSPGAMASRDRRRSGTRAAIPDAALPAEPRDGHRLDEGEPARGSFGSAASHAPPAALGAGVRAAPGRDGALGPLRPLGPAGLGRHPPPRGGERGEDGAVSLEALGAPAPDPAPREAPQPAARERKRAREAGPVRL